MSLCVHESGHAIAMLVSGVRVDGLEDGPVRGETFPDPTAEMSPWLRVVVGLAGAEAVRSLTTSTGLSARPSQGDCGFIENAMAEAEATGHLPDIDRARSRARQLVNEHAEEISHLAAVLAARGSLSRDDLARLCWEEDSPLAEFRGLYSRPAEKPTAVPALTAARKTAGPQWRRVNTARGIFG